MEYETNIGLEAHCQLATRSKIFCGCRNEFGAGPNTQTCPVCLGLPGVLPVLNRKVLLFATKAALALNCKISDFVKFDRKNYFYPDLPKNYQISQYDRPLSCDGYVDIDEDGKPKRIRIRRVHLEEDAGKLFHEEARGVSLVDFNRTGIPLLEVVSEPDLASPEQAYSWLGRLKAILEYLEISDCNMEEGSLRCDANISVRPKGRSELGVKAEVKNMNSFKAIKSALDYEVERQKRLLADHGKIVQETRLWDEGKGITTSMRAKEESFDYRYFPEPDLVPFVMETQEIDEIRKSLPELPQARAQRFEKVYEIPRYDAEVLTSDKKLADYFEEAAKIYDRPKLLSNWIMGEVLSQLNLRSLKLQDMGFSASSLVGLLKLIDDGTISIKIAKEILPEMIEKKQEAKAIVEARGLIQISDEASLMKVVDRVIEANPATVEDYKKGIEKALGFLVGKVMSATEGRANPKVANKLLRERLKK